MADVNNVRKTQEIMFGLGLVAGMCLVILLNGFLNRLSLSGSYTVTDPQGRVKVLWESEDYRVRRLEKERNERNTRISDRMDCRQPARPGR